MMRRACSGSVILLAMVCPTAVCAQQFEEEMARARTMIAAGQWAEALGAMKALEARTAGDDERDRLAFLFFEVGVQLSNAGDFARALPAFEAALAMYTRMYESEDHMNVAANLNNVAACLMSLGRAREALPRFEAAAAMYQRLNPDRDHPFVVTNLRNAARCFEILGRFDEALHRRETVLAMQRRLRSNSVHPDVVGELAAVASCFASLNRFAEALACHQEALSMQRVLHGERDHPDVAECLNRVARVLEVLGRADEALPQLEAALAMHVRLCDERDHTLVAQSLGHVASCLESLGRAREALANYEAALAMQKRLHAEGDHPDVALVLNNLAHSLWSMGRADEALPYFEAALAMDKRLGGDGDHPAVASGMNNLASCLERMGRVREALSWSEAGLAMSKRIYGDSDHLQMATALNSTAFSLQSNGRNDEALPHFEAALAMRQRLAVGRDDVEVATSLSNVATCVQDLGRASEALPRYEAALAMMQRRHGDRDHPEVVTSLGNVAACLLDLGRAREALPLFESALALSRRIYGEADQPDVATSRMSVAYTLATLGRNDEALPHYEAALAMLRRVYGDRDHPAVATSLNNLGGCLQQLGRAEEALGQFEAAMTVRQRLCGDRDHPDLAKSLHNVARCLHSLDRTQDALGFCERAAAMIERLREASHTSATLRQSLFDSLKLGGTFELLQTLTMKLGMSGASLRAAEHSRSRDLLDLLEQQHFDPLDEAARRAELDGDAGARQRIRQLRAELADTTFATDRLHHTLARLDQATPDTDRESRRAELVAKLNEVGTRQRQLLDERARMLGDVLAAGRVRTPEEIQSVLREGELFLEFAVTEDVVLLYVFARAGGIEIFRLPTAFATVEKALPAVLARASRAGPTERRGIDPDARAVDAGIVARSRELFASLIPSTLWERLRGTKHVFVALHRTLHRLPLELLVTDVRDDKTVYWLDAGPPITYVASGSVLHWLRQRPSETRPEMVAVEMVAIGDPEIRANAPAAPEQGVLVQKVSDGGEGARIGLHPFDVLTRYDEQALVDDISLEKLRFAAEAAMQQGQRPTAPVPIELWRHGATLRVEARPGVLGIEVGLGAARGAHAASLDATTEPGHFVHKSDLERISKLPQLKGARAEAEAIAATFRERGAKATLLLGSMASESAVATAAGQTRYLHFACHGIAEECAGQSLSMLVLAQPETPEADDDGLLKLTEMLHSWRGRLTTCRLVVLSACQTNVGPTNRDDAPQALPLGFMFAGAPSVISSLWAVDDASTREFMTDFYGRLLAGETDKLKSFTEAKKALRQKYPDPFHWAPFIYMGVPE